MRQGETKKWSTVSRHPPSEICENLSKGTHLSREFTFQVVKEIKEVVRYTAVQRKIM